MPSLDFLPARYREGRRERRRQWWRLGVAGLFGAAVLAAAGGQWSLNARAQRQARDAAGPFAAAQARQQAFLQLQTELHAARADAALCVYLADRWPASRLLAAAAPTGSGVVLREIELSQEHGEAVPAWSATGSPETEAPPAGLPAEEDLASLQREFGAGRTVLRVTGSAETHDRLHAYLGELAGRSLLARVDLVKMESPGGTDEVEFEVRLSVREGHAPDAAAAAPDLPDSVAAHPAEAPR